MVYYLVVLKEHEDRKSYRSMMLNLTMVVKMYLIPNFQTLLWLEEEATKLVEHATNADSLANLIQVQLLQKIASTILTTDFLFQLLVGLTYTSQQIRFLILHRKVL